MVLARVALYWQIPCPIYATFDASPHGHREVAKWAINRTLFVRG
jgi:hypothetical protein